MGLAARQQPVVHLLPLYVPCPCPPPLLTANFSLKFTPFYNQHTRSYILYSLTVSTVFSATSLPPPSPPAAHSFSCCHYGPTLTQAFIKCQLYTRDHTTEERDTMIPDPKRSACLWAFSSSEKLSLSPSDGWRRLKLEFIF